MMNDQVSQFSILRMHGDHHQRASGRSVCILYDSFIIQHRSPNVGSAGSSSSVPTLDIEHQAISSRIHNGGVREKNGSSEETALLHTDMCHPPTCRIKNDMDQDTIFSIREDNFVSEMEL